MDARPLNVWTTSLTARQARAVAKGLKDAGYTVATIDRVRELAYVNAIAEYLEPGDIGEQNRVRRLICESAGIQPKRTNYDR